MKTQRAALAMAFLPVGCSGDTTAAISDVARQDVESALTLASDGLDSKEKDLLEAYRLVEKHSQADTFLLLVDALEDQTRAAIHLLGMLHWDHPEPAFEPLRRLLVDKGPPLKQGGGGMFIHVDRGIVRGETAMALASLGDLESYDEFLDLVRKDPHPIARQQAAWALGELGKAEAIDPLNAIAKTLAPGQEADLLGSIIRVAIERLEFLRDHSGNDADTVAAARAVCRIAGSSENQVKRIEPALSSLRALEPTVRTKLLEAWSADDRRPTIASVSKWARKRLESP